MNVVDLYKHTAEFMDKEVTLSGWIRNHRKQKSFGFIDFQDGTCFKHVQVVYSQELTENFDEATKLKNGSAIEVKGKVVQSEAKGQTFEVKAEKVTLLGDATDEFPIQPKRHTREFLREQAYLRPRTNLFQAVFRIRAATAKARAKCSRQPRCRLTKFRLTTTAALIIRAISSVKRSDLP